MKQFLFIATILCASLSLYSQPLNDIVDRTLVAEKPLLAYQPLQERDLLWEKRVWRVIDAREKINLPFMYPQKPFFEIITDAAVNGEIHLYSTESEFFTLPLSVDEIHETLYERDTVRTFDTETYTEIITPIENYINYENIKRFRIKEVWYFDSKTSSMQVRILGIAPLLEVYGEGGDFRYEKPLFWLHYPSAREMLSRQVVFNPGNDASRMTWEDLFEIRKFSSYIYKESNVRDNRLEDLYSGVDLLLEADKINQEIFNYEHDRWSY